MLATLQRIGWLGIKGQPTVNASITILVSLADHLINLIVGQLLADRRHNVSQLGRRDEAVVVTVEDLIQSVSIFLTVSQCDVSGTSCLESFPNLLLGVGILHLSGHHGEEF